MPTLPENERLLFADELRAAMNAARGARPIDAIAAIQQIDYGSLEVHELLGVLAVRAPGAVTEAVADVIAARRERQDAR